jgi:hypothetical protein
MQKSGGTYNPRRRNRRLNAKKRIKREFFKASIFTKKKRAIFKTLKKARVFQKSGKNSGKSAFFTQNSVGSRVFSFIFRVPET